ncbi:hypothetical protein MGA5115_02257 [Marinomonas gallaica]|uniref:DUF2474 domain-containing protein n=1 Tax=Marinomonas gallaica TaxID=1806667 RepID=A0A1C3JSQ8_9GAMM|nr:hypothetical protein MGA5115_02257 [Marinomonas gallaica]SBT22516.1 hypothetical protein MGA5116_03139 [Marinomonas gallaica]
MKLKSWQWFALLYLIGIISVSALAYAMRLIINTAV